jgi:hypothetical protein
MEKKTKRIIIMIFLLVGIPFLILKLNRALAPTKPSAQFIIESDFHFGYNLSKPAETFKLKNRLQEISGLSFSNKHTIACIQDEDGEIFFFDVKKEEVTSKVKFAKDADYEGVEFVGKLAYAVKMNGTLYEIENIGKKNQDVTKYETVLNPDNDVEGLAYDAKENRLLLACKGKAGDGKRFKNKKAIYQFDLVKKKLDPHPAFLISQDSIRQDLKGNKMRDAYADFVEFFSPKKGSISFQPSGISVHPITGNIFVISATANLLVVMNREGKTLYMEKLPGKLFKQPEGITFSQNGDLFIANEGQGKTGKGRIHKFDFSRK